MELPWDSAKYRKRIKEYPKPGPLSSKPSSNVVTRTRSRLCRKTSSTSQPVPDSTTTLETQLGVTSTNMATSSSLFNGEMLGFNDSSDSDLNENVVNGRDEVVEEGMRLYFIGNRSGP